MIYVPKTDGIFLYPFSSTNFTILLLLFEGYYATTNGGGGGNGQGQQQHRQCSPSNAPPIKLPPSLQIFNENWDPNSVMIEGKPIMQTLVRQMG